MNTPSAAYIEGEYASIIISTMDTNVAIIMINIGSLTVEGICFLISDTNRLENTNTKAVPADIPIAFSTDVVTARVGQRPSTRPNVGLSRVIPLMNSLKGFILLTLPLCPFY